MNEWYHRYIGRKLLTAESYYLDKIISRLFGYYLVQLGGPADHDFLAKNLITHKLRVDPEDLGLGSNFIRADFDALPFLPESIDVFVVAHVLEFVRNPRVVLEEVYQALAAGGSLVIFGFNAFSIWGMVKLFKNRKNFPWHGRFWSVWRVQRWLKRLDLEIVERHTCCFNLPLGKFCCLSIPNWLERILDFLLPGCGASYVLLCKKRIIPLNPIKERLLRKQLSVAKSCIKPTSYYEKN